MTWRHDSMTNNHFWAYTWKQKLFSMSQESALSIWHMTTRHRTMTNNNFWDYTWKQKLIRMSQGSTLSIWHMTAWHHGIKTWQHDKQSLWRLHMKTKVDQHVPRINIKHMTYYMTSRHDSMTFLVPSCCQMTFDIFLTAVGFIDIVILSYI